MSPYPSNRGFALLVTITLLAFLILLLVSLASMTRVETQISSNNQQIAQARQNAIFSLNVAIGQLQKYTGPDQRVTATADIAGGAAGARLAPGGTALNKLSFAAPDNSRNAVDNGLAGLQSGTRYWTGVWGNKDVASDSYKQTPAPVLLNWLVSGNEEATFEASGAASSFGQIVTPGGNSVKYHPTAAVSGISTSMTTSTKVEIDGKDAVLLVGPNSAGSTPRNTPDGSEAAVDRYVVAPLRSISAVAGSVPGLGSTATPTIGRYAWWVGDEGAKARLNLVDPQGANNATTGQTSGNVLARYRLSAVSRSGVELVSDFNTNSLVKDSYLSLSQEGTSGALLGRVVSFKQGLLLNSTGIVWDGSASANVRFSHHVHDLTIASVGIEADSLNGGLRRDLTAAFEAGMLPPALDSTGIIAQTFSPILSTQPVPTWNTLASFYRLANSAGVDKLTGTNTDRVRVRGATATQVGISPVITLSRLLLGAKLNPGGAVGSYMTALVTPLVVVGNPYNVDLYAPDGLTIEYKLMTSARSVAGDALPAGNTPASFDRADPQIRAARAGFESRAREVIKANGTGLIDKIKFRIPGPLVLGKGRALLYSLQSDVWVDNITAGTARTVDLAAGLDPGSYRAVAYNFGDHAISPAETYKLWTAEYNSYSPMQVDLMDGGTSELLQSIQGVNVDTATSAGEVTMKGSVTGRVGFRVFEVSHYAPGDTFDGATTGIHNTSLRLYQDFNIRAGVFRQLKKAYTVPPFWGGILGSLATSGVTTPDFYPSVFTRNLDIGAGALQPWGRAAQVSGGVTENVLYDIPRRVSVADELPILSLGQLQHANLTADDVAVNVGHQPGNALGNSYSSTFLPREKTIFSDDDHFIWVEQDVVKPSRLFDMSYLLNAAMWDQYYFSTLPQTGSVAAPVNSRLVLIGSPMTADIFKSGGGADYPMRKTAAYIGVRGGFNVNSTSIDAWTALLAGMRGLPPYPESGDNATATAFARSIRQPNAGTATPGGTEAGVYSGFRRLTDTQVSNLAAAIVKQVRMRGPFLSLAQFINRSLVSVANDGRGLGFSGALQGAIDQGANLNDFAANASSFKNKTGQANTDAVTIPDSTQFDYEVDTKKDRGTMTLYADGQKFADMTAINPAPAIPAAQRSTGIPGWLTQADILQALGPVLSARSDTFTIRTYGDSINPVTAEVTGRAWCEAVVQRFPEYIDAADGGLATWGAATEPSLVNKTNQDFGRRYKIISFRWLSASDI